MIPTHIFFTKDDICGISEEGNLKNTKISKLNVTSTTPIDMRIKPSIIMLKKLFQNFIKFLLPISSDPLI